VAARLYGWDELHPLQTAAMTQVLTGRDTLLVAPTGFGKSAVYQVPAVLMDGPTVVVSPLLALQRDQVKGLTDSQAPDARVVNSSKSDGANSRSFAALPARRCGGDLRVRHGHRQTGHSTCSSRAVRSPRTAAASAGVTTPTSSRGWPPRPRSPRSTGASN
jgi:hypothetical protein